MSGRTLNGNSFSNNVYVNTLSGGEALAITTANNSTSSTIDLKISKQDTQSTFEDTDMIVIEDASGNIKKVLGSVVKDSADGFFTKVSSNIYPDATSENLLLGATSNSNSRKLLVVGNTELQDLYLQLNKKIISSNNSDDYLQFGDRTFTNNYLSNVFTYGVSFGATADINLATGRAITLGTSSTDRITFNSGNTTFGNTGIFNNSVFVKATVGTNSGHVSFFEASDNGTNNIDLHSPETLTHDYNAYLPKITDTNITSVYILSNKNVLGGTNVNISNSTTDTITVNMDTTINGTITFSSIISGSINGNAGTATKIASITNSNIVQLTDSQTLTNKTFGNNTIFSITPTFNATLRLNGGSGIAGQLDMYAVNGLNFISLKSQDTLSGDFVLTLPARTDTLITKSSVDILSNKSFSDMPVCEVGLAVKQTDGSTSGNIRFFDKDNSNRIDLHIENHTVSGDFNMYLPNDIDETVLLGTRNTQTVINKTLSTGTIYNGNTIGVAYGGTGLASYTSGDLIYASGTTTLSKLAIGADKRFLMSNGSAPVWNLGPTATNPLKFTDLDISLFGLNGFGTNNQIITTTGSQLSYSSTLTSVALSSCSGNISQFTNDSAYLTSITTPLTTAVNFGTSATGAVSIGKSNQGLNLIGNGIFLDYTVPFTIGIVSEFIASSLISYDGSITSMVFGEKGGSGYNSAIHSNTVLNLSLTNSAYDITMSSTAGDITYTSPEHHFSGIIKTFGSSIFVGADNSAGNLEVAINHSTSSGVGSSFVVFYYNSSSNPQIGDIGQVGTSSVAFNETSDYRLKTEIEDFNNNLDIINKLKVRKYKFISDVNAGIDLPFIGFIAHECNEASEYFDTVVSGKKDETAMWCKKCNSFNCKCGDDCGDMIMKNKYQAIDYGKFTPYTVGAIQELYAIIQEQQKVINNLLTATSFKDFKSK